MHPVRRRVAICRFGHCVLTTSSAPAQGRQQSKALYPRYPAYVHAKMEALDETEPIRYEIGGKEYRRWGYMATFQVLSQVSVEDIGQSLKAVLPAYTIRYDPPEQTDTSKRETSTR